MIVELCCGNYLNFSLQEVAARKMVDIPLEILGMPKEGDSFSDRVLKWIGRRSGILSRKAVRKEM